MRKEIKKEEREHSDVMSKVRIMNVSDDPMLIDRIHLAFKDGVNNIFLSDIQFRTKP